MLRGNVDVNASNESGETPLHVAMNRRKEELIELLVDTGEALGPSDRSGADVNASVSEDDKHIIKYVKPHDYNFESPFILCSNNSP